MDLWTALRTVGRHWRVLLLGLAMTGVVLVVLAVRVEQRYSATGTVIVISPGGRANPLDVYSSSSSLAASVATTLGSDDASKAAVLAQGGTSEYTLVTDPSLPIITITTTSADRGTAVRSFGLVLQVMNRLLADRQREFATPQSADLQVLSVTAPASAKVTTYKLVVLGIAGALGTLAAVSVTFIAESAADRRRGRAQVQEATPATPLVSEGPSRHTEPERDTSTLPASQPAPARVSDPKPDAELTPLQRPEARPRPSLPKQVPTFSDFLAAQAVTPPPTAPRSPEAPLHGRSASTPAAPKGAGAAGARQRRPRTK
jgi:hypothetical protein